MTRAQVDGSAQRQDREAGLIGEADDSPVGSEADDAPNLHPNLPSPSGDRNTVLARERAELVERWKATLDYPMEPYWARDLAERTIAALKSDTPEPSGGQIELVAQRFSERASEAIHGMFDWEGVSDTLWEELTIKLYDVAAEELSAIAAIHPTPIGVSELADELERLSFALTRAAEYQAVPQEGRPVEGKVAQVWSNERPFVELTPSHDPKYASEAAELIAKLLNNLPAILTSLRSQGNHNA